MSVNYNVPLIPQTTGMSCWAAGIAMILAWRNQVSIDPSQIALNPGGIAYLQQFRTDGLNPNDTYILRRWGLITESPCSYTVAGFDAMLSRYGPLWVAAAVPGAHIRVVTGVMPASTPENTLVSINDPWERGMSVFRMPNRGSHYYMSYKDLTRQQETLGRRELTEAAPIYLAHLP